MYPLPVLVYILLLPHISTSDIDSLIDIVYNPSAGPFQDTSQAFYKPRQGKTLGVKENFVFPDRVEINRVDNRHKKHKKQSTAKKAKLLRDGKKIEVAGGLDFGEAVFDESMGKRCILKREEIDTVERKPTLVCTHR